MKACVIFCTIRHTKSFESYATNFRRFNHNPDIIIVDETGDTRSLISKAFHDFHTEFYGALERAEWFKTQNVSPLTVPPKTTDVVGFALLIAYSRHYDVIAIMDDDTYPIPEVDFLGEHNHNLCKQKMEVVSSTNSWINPHPKHHPRGYPYTSRNIGFQRTEVHLKDCCPVLNMGMWKNVPDLNAIDYLYLGSLTGQYSYKGNIPTNNFAIGKGCFIPLARMNIAFLPEIIPAFYQFTGNAYGIGRYGDIFSGLFIMKIAHHLGEDVTYGSPLCIHNKEPRDVFRDINSELESIKLNETMHHVLNDITLTSSTYSECYLQLAKELLLRKDKFHLPHYIAYLSERMQGWVQAIET